MVNFKTIFINAIKYFLIILSSALCGLLLLIVAFCFPTQKIKDNIMKEKEFFSSWNPSEEMFDGIKGTYLNNYTDGVMLNISVCDKEDSSLLDRALSIYEYLEVTEFEGFRRFCEGESDVNIVEYSRYWTGYLVILRPMLCLFTYHEILYINGIFQLALIIFIVYLLIKSNSKKLAFVLAAGFVFMAPMTWAVSLCNSLIINLLLIEIALMLWFRYKNKSYDFYLFLLFTGIAVSFVDYLTFPMITLTIAILIDFCNKQESTLIKRAERIILAGISWSFGYLGMWVSKWIILALFGGFDKLREAVGYVIFRTSASDISANKVSRWDALSRNLSIWGNKEYMITLTVFVVLAVLYVIKKGIDIKGKGVRILTLLVTMIIPVFWLLIKANHSYIHFWMTYRELVPSVMCLLLIILLMGKDTDYENNSEKI